MHGICSWTIYKMHPQNSEAMKSTYVKSVDCSSGKVRMLCARPLRKVTSETVGSPNPSSRRN